MVVCSQQKPNTLLMSDAKSNFTIKCPDCLTDINLEGGVVGDYFECEDCYCELIISSLDPAAVEVVEEEK